MAVYWQEFRSHCVAKLAEHEQLLQNLESGLRRVHRRETAAGPWIDATAVDVEITRRAIAECQGLISRIDKDHPGGPLMP